MMEQHNFRNPIVRQHPIPSGATSAIGYFRKFRLLFHAMLSLGGAAFLAVSVHAETKTTAALNHLAGTDTAILVEGEGMSPAISINPDKLLIPASTLKIITSLAVFQELGTDFRFKTEFYLDAAHNLTVKGYGDPLLISEEVAVIAQRLKTLLPRLNHLIVDATYFADIAIPGIVGSSAQPYNAPVGALCVNFNTVNFEKRDGKFISAEPQTPLLPFALERIKKSGQQRGRIVLTAKNHESALYAGHLLRFFLSQAAIPMAGTVTAGFSDSDQSRLIYTHQSTFTLEQVVNKLMIHSNNFISNQALITAGANRFGAPGTLDKGLALINQYLQDELKLNNVKVTEGSGVSSQNRLTARDLFAALETFKPYYALLRQEDREYYKTGTLPSAHVNARAGYFAHNGKLRRFVVISNTPGVSIDRIMQRLRKL